MFTESYRGYFIHGYLARLECQVQRPDRSILGGFKSLHAAKLAITRAIKAGG